MNEDGPVRAGPSPELLISRAGVLGKLVLNRPAALNALSLDMCRAMDAQLHEWLREDGVEAVVIRQAGARAFSAGGDVRQLYGQSVAERQRFWRAEYRLDALIRRYRKPYIAFVDGIVMGGGFGVSGHGSHRVLTENALFAMPETAIGMVPDVGSSYVLARMPGALGLYLGLTGARLKTADALYAGFGTHLVAREHLDALEAGLSAGGLVDDMLARFAARSAPAPLADRRAEIDRHFGADTIEAVVAGLERSASAFARETLEALKMKSPLSLKLAFRLLRESRDRTFEDCLGAEWRIVSRLHEGSDFDEGVRALIIDKDGAPRWRHSTLDQVSDEAVEHFFAPRPGDGLDLG